MPPYIVFGDATLRLMALHKAAGCRGLLAISGVGERKFAEYGEAFLAALRESPA